MRVPVFTALAAWLDKIGHQSALMRPRSRLYKRFDRTARTLTSAHIRRCDDAGAIAELAGAFGRRAIRAAMTCTVSIAWSRAELGVLITEAENRGRQLALGRLLPRLKGPRLDPLRLPDEWLEHLIQQHRGLRVVEALRPERRRREQAGRRSCGPLIVRRADR